jgi:tetratricopeptide (TPR) repeat protein
MTRDLLVVLLDPPLAGREGDFYYRTLVPGRALAAAPGVHVISLDNSHRSKARLLFAADVLVLNSVADPDLLPLLAERRARRCVTVYEISDDITAVPPWNPVHYFWKSPDNVRLLLRLAKSCDGVQYSTGELERLYGHLNPRGRVLRNQLPAAPPPRQLRDDGPLVIGWGGSRGHLEDMAAIAAPLIDWVLGREGVRLHLMCAEAIYRLFDRLPAARKRRTLPGAMEAYEIFLRGLDIGLAPLLDTGFNRARSDVKFLEYAAHGVVPVVQALVPYLETVRERETGFLFRDVTGLLGVLDELYRQPALRHQVVAAAYGYAAGARLATSGERLSFYEELLERSGHAPQGPSATAIFDEMCRLEGGEVTGRHLHLSPSRYEKLLHEGLLLSQQLGRHREAVRALQAGAQMEPACPEPHLYLAASGHEVEAELHAALSRNPRSLQSLLALGLHQARAGQVERAIETFVRMSLLCPEWEVAHLRLAQLLRDTGRPIEAARCERRGLELIRSLLPEAPPHQV